MEWTEFLHADANPGKLKFDLVIRVLGLVKNERLFRLLDLKIFYILRMNLWIELIFCMLTLMK